MVEITMEKVSDLKKTVVAFFKDATNSEVEVTEWHVNTVKTKDGNTIDFGTKLLLKPKKKK
ncbi:MAG TPA: hypothetical protein VKF39_01320 [Nitrososphaerales archaeon]|nr:hypothetical protein [Nitrososphaerales archaeon]